MTAPTDGRGRGQRREVILEAAADLFSARGYAATGIDEIGEAAGITGPGVYRHFGNKNEVLSEVVRRAIAQVVEGVAVVLRDAGDDWELLGGLVDNMIDAVLRDPQAWSVLVREQRHLEPASARWLARAHRLHVEEWVVALARIRPELSDAEVRVLVHGVLGVTAPFAVRDDTGLGHERVAAILREMAMRILRQSVPAEAR